ncbi:Cof-type HAD-IIB family hydrolase [Pelosinus sp. IPA-1]|uniref:Cof-type HAD-IIB family hydrolase n=1 Tax=Pelosinus sp. IPA-1 TaxID=3029569 RepID=UPI0024362970|nr:Cof-type HAD-IIB family hydrolase [Pelosinus sp. IPA-1]GMA97216.1 haloacid dehalogenase [Pelosinus sp. IPA-1]
MIKLIASDMDGTLIFDQKISKENLEAIHAAQKKGIKFAIATGRAYEDVKPFLDQYGLTCECVVLNGGEYRDIAGSIVEGIYIDKSLVTEIMSILSESNLAVEIYTNNGYYTTNTEEEIFDSMVKRSKIFRPHITDSNEIYQNALNHPHFVKMKYITNIDEFLKSNVEIGKFISFADTANELYGPREKLNKLRGIVVSSSFTTNIEINDRYATKGRILAKAAARMGINKDEVAILGDGFNDYSMFVEFPNSFAMENAIPEIKEVAKYITASNVEHGVAKAIYRILER